VVPQAFDSAGVVTVDLVRRLVAPDFHFVGPGALGGRSAASPSYRGTGASAFDAGVLGVPARFHAEPTVSSAARTAARTSRAG
jgi:hypothetical protein